MNAIRANLPIAILILSFTGCQQRTVVNPPAQKPTPATQREQELPASASPQLRQFLASAFEQTQITTGYDPSYVALEYPGGDVAPETGVCSDVLVRAFRTAGIDLQKEVHEDMSAAWSSYPREWGAGRPDSNIDHRRVLNLMTFFKRKGKTLPVTNNRSATYQGTSWPGIWGGSRAHRNCEQPVDRAGPLTNNSQHWIRSEG